MPHFTLRRFFLLITSHAPCISYPLSCSLIFIGLSLTTLAQSTNESAPSASDKLSTWAKEVYQDCPEYATEEHLKIYKAQVAKIVITEVEDLSNHQDAIDLATVGLKNKCNTNLQHDTAVNFSMESFNPLKYFFDFYASEDKAYNVLGTNYIITIAK